MFYSKINIKPFLFNLLLLYFTTSSFAQEIPAFGTVDTTDLKMKDCNFDKGAAAVKLIDYCDIHYEGYKNTFMLHIVRRVRIKILKDKAFDYANIKLKFYSKKKYETITDIIGNTYNLDKQGNMVTTRLDKSSIYKRQLDKKSSEIAFTLPDVKVGSIIEYTYTDERESPTHLEDWYLQDVIPTRLSVYKILIPAIFNFAIQVKAFDEVEQTKGEVPEQTFFSGETIRYNSSQRSYTARDILGLRDEPYMSSAKDYLQRIIFQLSSVNFGYGNRFKVNSSWRAVTDNLLADEDFGGVINDNGATIATLNDTLQNIKDEYSRLDKIYKFIQANLYWNGSESILGTPFKMLWVDKSGSNADINLCLVALLRNAGFAAFPLLVSTRDNGEVNKTYPFFEQFNGVMAYILIDNKSYILNAADKYNPIWTVPSDVINTEGFVIDTAKGGWVHLEDAKSIYKKNVSLIASITQDGIMEGNAKVTDFNYSKNERIETLQKDKEHFNDYFSKNAISISLKKIQIANENNDSLPLVEDVEFSMPVNVSGDYIYFPINIFLGLNNNPFIADERWTDIDFGYKKSYKSTAIITIPDTYEFSELPAQTKFAMPDTSIIVSRTVDVHNNEIKVAISIDFLDNMYPAVHYIDFQKIYKKMLAMLSEEVVIKRKKS